MQPRQHEGPSASAGPRALHAVRRTSALTTDYVFRGFSQTAEGAAIQGGFDATCGMFYAGMWASSAGLMGGDRHRQTCTGGFPFDAHVEVDFYAGIKPKTGRSRGISGSSTTLIRTPHSGLGPDLTLN